MDTERVRPILDAFEREGVRYAVFGGVALNLHGIARFTEDLDVFIAPESANVDAVKRALRSVYDDPSIEEITAADLLGEYPAVQYVPPSEGFHLDILTRLGTAFRFTDLETQRILWDGLPISVVTPRMLYRMKRNTVRLKDRADAEALRRRFELGED